MAINFGLDLSGVKAALERIVRALESVAEEVKTIRKIMEQKNAEKGKRT